MAAIKLLDSYNSPALPSINDVIPIIDVSTNTLLKTTISDLTKSFGGLPQTTSIDKTNDSVLLWEGFNNRLSRTPVIEFFRSNTFQGVMSFALTVPHDVVGVNLIPHRNGELDQTWLAYSNVPNSPQKLRRFVIARRNNTFTENAGYLLDVDRGLIYIGTSKAADVPDDYWSNTWYNPSGVDCKDIASNGKATVLATSGNYGGIYYFSNNASPSFNNLTNRIRPITNVEQWLDQCGL